MYVKSGKAIHSPTTSYTIVHDLDPALVVKIKEAFFGFDFANTALGKGFERVSKIVPITYQDQWAVIREIQASNGVQYTPQGLADN